MRMDTFEQERMQSTWENIVDIDLSESGVYPVKLNELQEMGLDLEDFAEIPLGYSQSNGTPELRELIAQQYPGSNIDQIEVMNGTSEANFIVCHTLTEKGDSVGIQHPNYLQFETVARSFGAEILPFRLIFGDTWEPDWDDFENAISQNIKMLYVTNPNNPTGSVFSRKSMERIITGIEKAGAYLIADEVYQGAELDGDTTASFWGMSDRVIVTSGLSKAYSLPGVRIGWVVGPAEIIAECWKRHDSITIAPGILSDKIAQTVLKPENRKKLYSRTAEIIGSNREYFKNWVDSFDGFLEYIEPTAGAIAFVKYNSDIPSIELAEKFRLNQDVLVVPGGQMGMEGFIRLNLGPAREKFEEGLKRIKTEFESLRVAV